MDCLLPLFRILIVDIIDMLRIEDFVNAMELSVSLWRLRQNKDYGSMALVPVNIAQS